MKAEDNRGNSNFQRSPRLATGAARAAKRLQARAARRDQGWWAPGITGERVRAGGARAPWGGWVSAHVPRECFSPRDVPGTPAGRPRTAERGAQRRRERGGQAAMGPRCDVHVTAETGNRRCPPRDRTRGADRRERC